MDIEHVSRSPDTATALPDLRSRATFRHWTRIAVRYSDLDPIGHVNNTGLPMFFEEARLHLIYPILNASVRKGLELVLVRTVIEYLREIGYPDTVEIGSVIARLGSKSFVMAHGVFNGRGECVGTGECTMVVFDQLARTSTVPPKDVRQALLDLQ